MFRCIILFLDPPPAFAPTLLRDPLRHAPSVRKRERLNEVCDDYPFCVFLRVSTQKVIVVAAFVLHLAMYSFVAVLLLLTRKNDGQPLKIGRRLIAD